MPYTPQTQPKDERGRFAPTGDAGSDKGSSSKDQRVVASGLTRDAAEALAKKTPGHYSMQEYAGGNFAKTWGVYRPDPQIAAIKKDERVREAAFRKGKSKEELSRIDEQAAFQESEDRKNMGFGSPKEEAKSLTSGLEPTRAPTVNAKIGKIAGAMDEHKSAISELGGKVISSAKTKEGVEQLTSGKVLGRNVITTKFETEDGKTGTITSFSGGRSLQHEVSIDGGGSVIAHGRVRDVIALATGKETYAQQHQDRASSYDKKSVAKHDMDQHDTEPMDIRDTFNRNFSAAMVGAKSAKDMNRIFKR